MRIMSDIDTEKKWTTKAAKALIGKKIVKVQYMTKKNAGDLDWYQRPLMLKLDDGSLIFPQADDEGNDGGALVHYDKDKLDNDNHEDLYPVLWRR